MLFLLQVYHKVSSFFISCFLNTCALQYRLALSVSDANVNKDVQNTSGIVSDSNFLWVRRRFDVRSDGICIRSLYTRF